MRFLRIFRLGLELARLLRNVFLAVALGDELAYLIDGGCGQCHRVRAHIGNEANGAFAGDFDAFVEFLCNAHRTLRVETQFARGFLLQRRGRERCSRVAASLALGNGQGPELTIGCGENGFLDFASSRLVLKTELLDFFSPVGGESGQERLVVFADVCFDRPGLTRRECFDIELALADHSQRRVESISQCFVLQFRFEFLDTRLRFRPPPLQVTRLVFRITETIEE